MNFPAKEKSTYVVLLEVVRVAQGVLGGQDDVLEELAVGERRDLVMLAAEVEGQLLHRAGVEAARVDPLGLRHSVTSEVTFEVTSGRRGHGGLEERVGEPGRDEQVGEDDEPRGVPPGKVWKQEEGPNLGTRILSRIDWWEFLLLMLGESDKNCGKARDIQELF